MNNAAAIGPSPLMGRILGTGGIGFPVNRYAPGHRQNLIPSEQRLCQRPCLVSLQAPRPEREKPALRRKAGLMNEGERL